MEKVFDGIALGAKYDVHKEIGIVVQSDVRNETGTTGHVSKGKGDIQSWSVLHQTIYLEDEYGNEYTMKLQNQEEIHCKKGQTLTTLLIGSPGVDFKQYFFWYNHNTGDEYLDKSVVSSEMYPRTIMKIYMALVLLASIFIGVANGFKDGAGLGSAISSGIIILVAGGILYTILNVLFVATLAPIRSRIVQKNQDYKNLITELKNSNY